jgi:hypothetical protein
VQSYLGLLLALVLGGCGAAQVAAAPGQPRTGAAAPRQTQTGTSASCAGLSPAQQFAAARTVFVGVMLPGPTTVRDGRHVLRSPAKMRVERYLKGHGPSLVKVATAVTIESDAIGITEDGVEPQAGERWKIYSRSAGQPFSTSICLGSAQVLATAPGGRAALRLWARFPVLANPRPIVPLGEGAVLEPASGFGTAAQKTAYEEGRFVLRTALPVWLVTFGRYHLVSAATAYRRLRAHSGGQRDQVPPLIVTAVKPGSATFVTDRGRIRLPAWRFFLKDVAQPVAVLALGPPDLFLAPPLHRFGPPGPGSSVEDSAKTTAAGDRILISFPGALAGTGPCQANYRASTVSSERAVAVTITTIAAPVAPGQACPAIAVVRTAALQLARPLGARVLVSAIDGGAIPVTEGRPR